MGDLGKIQGRYHTGRYYLKQAVARGERVLATAASNTAVDNMAERLLVGRGALRQVVRVGHPARLLPAVVRISLDAKLATSDGGAIVRDIIKEIDDAQAQCRRCDGQRRSALRGEVRQLRRELSQRQQKSVRDLLMAAQVVLCTNTGAQDRALQL